MLLRAHAELLSQNQVVSGIIEEIITINEVFSLLPFVGVNGKAYLYKRENINAQPTVVFLNDNEDVPESSGQFTEVITKLRILIGDVDVDNFLRETMSDTEDQLGEQLAMKAKAMGRQFMDSMVTGNNVARPKEFDGLRALADATPAQVIPRAANGGGLTLDVLDQLVDAVPNKPDFLMMRSGTRRAYLAQLRLAGGNDGAMLQLPQFGKPVLTHAGIPILVNDFLPGNETLGSGTNLCSVYAVRANEADGVHGLYGGAQAGIRVENIGTVQNRDAIRTRLKWYCGMALKSTKSVARLAGITNI
jgi:hypothetical protein